MSNVDKWNRWYHIGLERGEPQPYGDPTTYKLGADFLADCDTVEDWGCGKGYLTNFIDPGRYRGIDGSNTPFADAVEDLAHYRPPRDPEGIFMRHVIEHDYRWRTILQNAVDSATKKLVLILFTPIADPAVGTHEISFVPPGVPNLSFALTDLDDIIEPKFDVTWEELETNTEFGCEFVAYCTVRDE